MKSFIIKPTCYKSPTNPACIDLVLTNRPHKVFKYLRVKNVKWECRKPVLKKGRFEKKFTPYPHFIVYDLEVRLVPLNKRPTGDLTYLSRHIKISVAVHNTLSEEKGEDLVYLVDKNQSVWLNDSSRP